ncbi:MAG: ATP-binding protein, partial [Euryarchaeota archaeon]|nr:ATP-binding protein [Euryarchaeota archaeon]
GAFGNYLDIENAKLIGLIPKIETRRIKFIGNAAGFGARIALISRESRRIIENIPKKIQCIELAADPNFGKVFTSALNFPT